MNAATRTCELGSAVFDTWEGLWEMSTAAFGSLEPGQETTACSDPNQTRKNILRPIKIGKNALPHAFSLSTPRRIGDPF